MISNIQHLYASSIETEVGRLVAYADDNAVVKVQFSDQTQKFDELPENDVTKLAIAQLYEYLCGKRTRFELPLKPVGTAFQSKVWQALCTVEYAQTVSYLHIANLIGNPKACRAVGAANGKNPIAIIIPCHRIIGADGTLTGYAGGLNRKAFLLDIEQNNR